MGLYEDGGIEDTTHLERKVRVFGDCRVKSSFTVAYQDDNSILLTDIGPWDQYKTITNDVDNVVRFMSKNGLTNDIKLYYIDSDGEKSEMKHKDGKFKGFGPILKSWK